MPKTGGLVEWTLAQEPQVIDGEEVPAHYEVLDMSKHPRWSANHFVTSEPWFKYYCGLPLRTENGINIGALFLLDDKPRDSTSLARLKVLHTLTLNIIGHMKSVKQAHEKQRAIHMNMCMADFLNPEHRLRSRQMRPYRFDYPTGFPTDGKDTTCAEKSTEPLEPPSSRPPGPMPEPVLSPQPGPDRRLSAPSRDLGKSPGPTPRSDSFISNQQHEYCDHDPITPPGPPTGAGEYVDTPAPSSGEEEYDNLDVKSDTEVQYNVGATAPKQQLETKSEPHTRPSPLARGRSKPPVSYVTEADHQRAFDRSAYLLRQSLDLSQFGGGGVVLLDTNARAASTDPIKKRHKSDYEDIEAMPEDHAVGSRRKSAAQPDRSQSAYSGVKQERVVLAAASISESAGQPKNFGRADPTWRVTLSPPELQRMCKRHPRGKLYDIPESVGTNLFDYEGRTVAGRLSAKLYELVLLRRQFPLAKQVIFIPMFHANLNRWTSCFAFTNSRYRIFTYDMDYLPMLSFTNAIKAEFVRLATVFADQQKSDFIGSVSHELRSPLHGILASLEFLQDTDMDAFQNTCVNTMDACAHTLLDTVAMVLDYNKVNTVERKTSMLPQQSVDDSSERPDAMPTQSGIKNEPLYTKDQDCNVALITEEVIDGLATGHLAKFRTNFGFDDAVSEVSATLDEVGGNMGMRRILQAVRPEVELIYDVQPPNDWSFSTHPGAIRRIVMNLFGNSLKYTKHGYIMVSLRWANNAQEEASVVRFTDSNRTNNIKLTVTDTGQGISPEYLRTKIYTPFAQENVKAAGAGLGLSIVRSIVGSLQGEIEIKSIVNVGTIVVVTLPMRKARRARASPLHTPMGATSPGGSEIILIAPQQRLRDPSVPTLQALQSPPQAAIYQPAMEHDSFGQTQGAAHVHATLVQYLTGWFGFPTLQIWDFEFPAKLLIVDDIHLPNLLAQRPDYFARLSLQSIIILCANTAREAVLSQDIKSNHVELVSKPFGPYKLARAICRALGKAAMAPTAEELRYKRRQSGVTTPGSTTVSSSTVSSSRKTRHRAKAKSQGENHVEPQMSPTGVTPASGGETHFEETAVCSEGHGHEVKASSDGGFPFPTDNVHGRRSSPPRLPRDDPSTATEHPSHLLPAAARKLIPLESRSSVTQSQSERVENSTTKDKINLWDKQPGTQPRKPRLLLVDDNRLNLQLLHTYISKKGYDGAVARTAEDGQQALEIYKEFMPDIIFMDLSMPLMDGFESTREIRAFEAERRADAYRITAMNEDGLRTYKPTFIIALTGNAKGSDQTEAFNCGMDMYMTKPVSFKQIGILLENWRDT